MRERERKRTRKRGRNIALREQDQYWWIVNGVPENEEHSAFVHVRFVNDFRDWKKLRTHLWAWFRARAGRTDISPVETLVLWAITERFRYQTFSSHDAYSYYAKMIGMNRRSVGRAVSALAEKGLIRVALEEERKLVEKAIAGKRKHILLVGLGYSLRKVV